MDRSSAAKEADEPRYRIQAVSDRTGIATATLRAWERRYGVPEPARSDARYRLYSERDVALVRRVAALCASGLRPAEAAKSALGEFVAAPAPERAITTTSESAIIEAIVGAARTMDLEALRAALDLAFTGRSAGPAYDAIVAPALRRIGELWASGELSVAAEHASSHVIRTLLSNLARLVTPQPSAPTAVLACFGDEQHDIGLLGFSLHVASWGYRPLFIGARVPPEALAQALETHRPRFVALSVVMAPPVEEAKDLLKGYAKVIGDVPWLLGGPGAPALADVVKKRGGHLASPDAETTRGIIARITANGHAAKR